MAFWNKYKVELSDYLGLRWDIEIQEDSTAGSTTYLTGTGSPLRIEYNSDSDEYNAPVRPSKAIFSVYSNTDFALTDFYTDEDFRLKVNIKYGSTLYWTGFIVTSEYSEPYSDTPYPVTITAVDGLTYLKNILYDDSGTYYTGRKRISKIILDILDKISITSFTESINIYEDEMNDTVDDSPLDQAYLDVSIFKDMSCYEVLQAILLPFNAAIRQNNGYGVTTTGSFYGDEILTDWTNAVGVQAFDTFTSSGKDITSAIDDEEGFQVYATSNAFTLNDGDILEINIDLTNNVTDFPWLYFHRTNPNLSESTSHWVLAAGLNTFTFTAADDLTDVYFYVSSPIPVKALNFSADCSAKLYLGTTSTVNYPGGVITIYRPEELTLSTVYARTFTAETTKTSSSYDPDQYIKRVTDSELKQVSGGALMIQAALKKITLNQDFGYKESWIENWELKGETFDGTDFESWTQPASTNAAPISSELGEGTDGAYLDSYDTSSPFAYYLEQEFAPYALEDLTTNYAFEIEFLANNIGAGTVSSFDVGIYINQGTHYVSGAITEGSGYDPFFTWVSPSVAYIQYTFDALVGSSGWKKITANFMGMHEDGPITIRLLASSHADVRVAFKNVKFYAYSTELSQRQGVIGFKTSVERHSSIFGSYLTPTKAPVFGLVTYKSQRRVVRKQYEATNSVFGKELSLDSIIGDVLTADTGIGNIITQFAGSIGKPGFDYRVDTITLTGGEGGAEAIITCDGETQVCEFDTDLATTAAKFVTDHAAQYASVDVTVTSSGADIIFTNDVLGEEFIGDTVIIPDLGTLDGTVALTTAARPDDSITHTEAWNTRSPGGENDPLLEIAVGEIGNQYSRPKQLIQMSIVETDANSPVLNIVKNLQDELNTLSGNNRKFVVNSGEFDIKFRRWNIDIIEII